jgi:hypothetical protein
MTVDGRCPGCGRPLAPVAERAPADATEVAPSNPITAENIDLRALAGEDAKAPWHFKLLVAAVVLYLVWRVVQLVVWAL